jgi:hypothetical protein
LQPIRNGPAALDLKTEQYVEKLVAESTSARCTGRDGNRIGDGGVSGDPAATAAHPPGLLLLTMNLASAGFVILQVGQVSRGP